MILTTDYFKYQEQIIEMLDEWTKVEKIVPSILRTDYQDFKMFVQKITTPNENKVPSTVYFAYEEVLDQIIGAVDIRHYLNEHLLFSGGHIGDGIRPSKRKLGYGTKLVELAICECHKLNINEILMIAEKTNIASIKTIIKNGGVLENEIIDHKGLVLERYWIKK